MTFRIITRGDANAPIVCDFRCEKHGVFEATVPRKAADCAPCPARVSIPADAFYPSGGESACGRLAAWTPSPVLRKVKIAEATRGKSDRPPGPGFLDTRELGEGMDHDEWQDKQDKQRADRSRAQLKDLLNG